MTHQNVSAATHERSPWPGLWALIIGFFMILIDTTIVSVANPSIQRGLDTDVDSVIWVTSAYLLAFAVPLLITGRLGDRFGPKNVYLVGLVIFTLASVWCGLADVLPGSGIANLIIARAVQGLGGALMSPQTMAVVTRTFPAHQRGAAMALWGSTAGVATLVGPLLGGVLVDGLGWEWIFFVNVPIGIAAFILAMIFVPRLETHSHRFDWLGVVISAVGIFFLVFGLQEGNTYDWNGWVIASIAAGILVLIGFVFYQHFNTREPLLPLGLFKDRNFSLANGTISIIGFSITAMFIPLIYYFQVVRGFTPTQSALMSVPISLVSLGLAPVVGRLTDRVHPRLLAFPGLVLTSLGLWLYVWLMSPDIAWGWLLIPAAVMGLGSAFMWAPVSATATRNLPPQAAGAGSGVFNTTRQVGSVIGSAAIAALITARLSHYLPGVSQDASQIGGAIPEVVKQPFTNAMVDSLMLPAAVFLVGAVLVLFFERPKHQQRASATPATE